MLGAGLIGVVAYGSWARAELTDRSDLDALILVTGRTALNRDLYRRWDEAPLVWNGLVVEPRFAYLPEAGTPVAAFWAEVALDGIVLFERAYVVSRRLVEIRRRLAGGELAMHSVHGQSYWVTGADMQNRELVRDHLRRAKVRLRALDVLFQGRSWPDVVRESQEVVELALKALLRAFGIEPPRIRDVSPVLLSERSRLPHALAPHVDELAEISRQLRRDRELAFYGAEDLTPSDFYAEPDAERARAGATRVVDLVAQHVDVGRPEP